MNKNRTCDDSDTDLTRARSVAVPGYTYFVRKDDEIKIGFTAYPWRRMKELARDFPGSTVVKIVSGEVAGEFETHRRFDHLRISQDSEWFQAAPELLSFIQALPPATIVRPAILIPIRPIDESPRGKLLTALRGKVRREPRGVYKEQLELMATMIENKVPAPYLVRQAEIMALGRSQH
jgi:hypothetical protein